MPVQVPEAISNINRDAVNNDKKHRQEFLGCIGEFSNTIFDLKEELKDSQFQELYEKLAKLFEFEERISTTIIFQVIQHKHKIDRQAKAKPKTEEEKIKQGYKRCNRCDALLKNDFSLQDHRKRNICKKVFVIKETERVASKPNGATTFTKKEFSIAKKNAFTLWVAYNDYKSEYTYDFMWRAGQDGYEEKLRDKVQKEKQRNIDIQEQGIAEKFNYTQFRKFTTYQSWKHYNM